MRVKRERERLTKEFENLMQHCMVSMQAALHQENHVKEHPGLSWLTLTEAVVRDDIMISEFIEELQNGYVPSFEFQGKLRRRRADGAPEFERVVFRDCVPDGAVDLMNISPGEVIKRSWTFRVNEPPEMLESFPA